MADATQTNGRARIVTLPRLFWIAASIDLLVSAGFALNTYENPHGEFDGLIVAFFAACAVLALVMMGVVAFIRRPAAYGIGLALAIAPYGFYGIQYLGMYVSTPSEQSLAAGHGYFKDAADRDLADAIMVGDSRNVASLARSANLNAIGWESMTFMRLAVIEAHAKPDVIVALLKAGINPDQDHMVLFGSIHDGEEADGGAMITGKNEKLLRAVIGTKVDLNALNEDSEPRFFTAVRWPAGLAIVLDNGAKADAPGKDGYTALMWAIVFSDWQAANILLAHGASLDHVAGNGKSPRSLLLAAIANTNQNHDKEPPELAALEARLHQ